MFDKFSLVNNNGSVLPGKFSDFLIAEHNIIKIDEQLHMYDDGIYVCSTDAIEKAMLSYFPEITQAKRRETLAQIKLKAKSGDDLIGRCKHLIAFKNGVYNTVTKKLMPFDSSYILRNRINWDYNPDAYSKHVDNFLDGISCHDHEIRAQLEEMIGHAMSSKIERAAAFILVSSFLGASNGKSSLQEILRHLLGNKNISATTLASLTSNRFAAINLYGKLANISDDISSAYIEDPSLFKSLSSGEYIQGEKKHGDFYEFESYATLIFSANRVPRVKDADGGVRRRMQIIPLLRIFKSTDPDFDPIIAERIIYGDDECTDADSMSYLINLGLLGLERIKINGFTKSKKSDAALSEYDRDCNPILDWCDEYLANYTDTGSFHMVRRDDAYENYKQWAITNGHKTMSSIQFGKFICGQYNLTIQNKYHSELYVGGRPIRKTFVAADTDED